MVELIYIYPGGCEEIIVTFITDKRMTLDEAIERADVDLNEYDYNNLQIRYIGLVDHSQ